jgi:hypothetical protein
MRSEDGLASTLYAAWTNNGQRWTSRIDVTGRNGDVGPRGKSHRPCRNCNPGQWVPA